MRLAALFVVLAFVPALLLADGTVSQATVNSAALGVTKSYVIYLPDGYAEGSTRYPVIYLVHGWGVDERTWSSPELEVQKVADGLNLQAIIVMPDGDRGVYVNSVTPTDYETCLQGSPPLRNPQEPRAEFCVRTPDYEDYMLTDIIPHIDSNYRTIATREARAITGESAGGLASMHLALRHTDLFASVTSHSGGLSMLYDPREGVALTSVENRPWLEEWVTMFGLNIDNWRQYDPYSLLDSLKSGELAVYFDSGTDDEFGFYQMALHFDERMTELGLDHSFVSVAGGKHDDAFFGSRITYSLEHHVSQFKQAKVYPDALAE